MGVSLNGIAASLHIFRKCVILLLPVLFLSFSVKLQQNRCRGNAHSTHWCRCCLLFSLQDKILYGIFCHTAPLVPFRTYCVADKLNILDLTAEHTSTLCRCNSHSKLFSMEIRKQMLMKA